MNSTNSSAKIGDHDMDTTSSASGSSRSEAEPEKDSTYGSCDSDDAEQRHSKLRDYQRRRTSGDREKFKRILLVLNEETEESGQLVVFTKLCEVLSFCTENSLSSMTADSIISLSCFPLRHDAVPALCQRMMAIKYLDVAEQCLQALEKISWEQPLACLQVVQILCNLFHYEDKEVLEVFKFFDNVALYLIRITNRVRKSPEMLDELCKHGLIE
ncbi:hypothetical protein CsatA_013229 [Cannabis sativa]